jgi:hypothetical protein
MAGSQPSVITTMIKITFLFDIRKLMDLVGRIKAIPSHTGISTGKCGWHKHTGRNSMSSAVIKTCLF